MARLKNLRTPWGVLEDTRHHLVIILGPLIKALQETCVFMFSKNYPEDRRWSIRAGENSINMNWSLESQLPEVFLMENKRQL